MKLLKPILLVTVAVLFKSCSNDNDTNTLEKQLLGTWRSNSGFIRVLENGDLISFENLLIDENNYTELTFNANGSFTKTTVPSPSEATVRNKNLITPEEGTYTLNGNTITTIIEGVEKVEKISITDGTLNLIYKEIDTNTNRESEENIAYLKNSL